MAASSSRAGAQFTGVVAALRSEARCLAPRTLGHGASHPVSGLLVEASGIGFERAARAAHNLVRAGAHSLLCWGVAGALDPRLRCGDVMLANEVISAAPLALVLDTMRPIALPEHARLPTSDEWREQLQERLLRQGPVIQGALLSSRELVCEASLKRQLFRDTGALAVDMESAAVGLVARLYDLPFMVLRVIADTAADELPAILRTLAGADSAGTPSWITWLPLACVPTAWPGLARMGQRYRVARRVLEQCAAHGRPMAPRSCASL